MRMERKTYEVGVDCPVCGDKVLDLYSIGKSVGIVTDMCADCVCNHLVKGKYDILSSNRVRESEKADAKCPDCGAHEMLVFVKSRNPLVLGTYYVSAVCGHCGRIFKIGDIPDNALSELDEDTGVVTIIPMDGCMIEVVWSHEHERLVGHIRDIPCRD